MAGDSVHIDDDLARRGRATAAEEGIDWPAYVSAALRRQIERDNVRRSLAGLEPPPVPGRRDDRRSEPGE